MALTPSGAIAPTGAWTPVLAALAGMLAVLGLERWMQPARDQRQGPRASAPGRARPAPVSPARVLPAPGSGEAFRDPLRSGGQGPEMVVIPAGTFIMGSPEDEPGRLNSEGPQHQVHIATAFRPRQIRDHICGL